MKKHILLISIIGFLICFNSGWAQSTFPSNGAPNPDHTVFVFTNCTLHVDAEKILANATLVVKDGKVVNAGTKVELPAGSVIKDLKGKHIYPSFIDCFTDYGIPEIKLERSNVRGPQMESNYKGAYGWNQAIRSEVEAVNYFRHDEVKADEYRKCGFGSVFSASKDGIVRGSGTIVLLNSNEKENKSIVKDKAAAVYSFNKGSSTQEYPSSQMGAIALLRQTYYDAQWYAALKNKEEYNLSLESFNRLQNLPVIFDADEKLTLLRAGKIAREFNQKYIIKGAGDEYQRAEEIQGLFMPLIIPLNFPEVIDVEDVYDSEMLPLSVLKHWEMAPANAAILEKNQIKFAITSSDLKDRKNFLKNLKKAVEHGLTEETALKALTTTPAQLLGVSDIVGSLKPGMTANFIITNKNLFADGMLIMENWVSGKPYIINDAERPDFNGKFEISFRGNTKKIELKADGEKISGTWVEQDTIKKMVNGIYKNGFLSLSIKIDSLNSFRLSGKTETDAGIYNGEGRDENGNSFSFKLTKLPEEPKKQEEKKQKKFPEVGEVFYPFAAYGKPEKSENIIGKFKNRLGAILIKNATVWTNEQDGILKDHDVYIVDGKIVRIAPNIDAPKLAFAKIIDAKGKHLTAGIIDEHSHIAISRGVNEGTKASSAEVRIGDVINPEDINIYRQLSGGVTTAQLLHGSANPIGGQSAIIKLRWGLGAEDMKFEKTDGFIKFALGENVKQSNWGDNSTIRFPQTRMGVEQVYFDFFTRAKAYNEQKMKYLALNEKDRKLVSAPRKDLELEALSEILNKKRFITCHSYVQSEINMLMKVADSMGFKVNTFTHILEGYKVADKMKSHGVNASTFADWWAYKMEVMDAIPYNAALLTKVGVNTSVNSDDAEMGRRLNQEAAKTIKYGGLSEEEALKLATLNPAKMLHIDDRVGSIKVGKQGDVVLWSDNPLSINARVEKTIIDGIIYFDIEEDAKLRDQNEKERNRIIQKMLQAKKSGEPSQKASFKKRRLYHCETMETEE